MKRVGDLDIDQDLDFEEREWRVQRVAWVLMVLLIGLALIGLFGTGPLSSATAGSAEGGIAAGYERFVRHGGKESVTFTLGPEQAEGGQIALWLSAVYLDKVDIEQITPQPDEVHGTGERHIYVFLAEQPTAPITVTFSFRPEAIGRLRVEAGVVDGPELTFTQLVYP